MKRVETLNDLEQNKKELDQRIEKLEAELDAEGWNEEKNRELNILRHHLRVCEERISGEWFKDEYCDDIELLPFK